MPWIPHDSSSSSVDTAEQVPQTSRHCIATQEERHNGVLAVRVIESPDEEASRLPKLPASAITAMVNVLRGQFCRTLPLPGTIDSYMKRGHLGGALGAAQPTNG